MTAAGAVVRDVSRQSMNVLLQGLSERGLVHRDAAPGPHGQRATRLAEPAGALLERARARVDLVVARMVDGLDRDRIAALRDALISRRDSLATE